MLHSGDTCSCFLAVLCIKREVEGTKGLLHYSCCISLREIDRTFRTFRDNLCVACKASSKVAASTWLFYKSEAKNTLTLAQKPNQIGIYKGNGQKSLPLEVNWWQTDILTPTLSTGQNHPYNSQERVPADFIWLTGLKFTGTRSCRFHLTKWIEIHRRAFLQIFQ
jgi:hypothetical protein